MAAHLQKSFRGEAAIARIGGEEFVVVMRGVSRKEAVTRLAGALQALADAPAWLDGEWVTIGASAGVAEDRRDGMGFEQLYRAADGALRFAKRSGAGGSSRQELNRDPARTWTSSPSRWSRTSP